MTAFVHGEYLFVLTCPAKEIFGPIAVSLTTQKISLGFVSKATSVQNTSLFNVTICSQGHSLLAFTCMPTCQRNIMQLQFTFDIPSWAFDSGDRWRAWRKAFASCPRVHASQSLLVV